MVDKRDTKRQILRDVAPLIILVFLVVGIAFAVPVIGPDSITGFGPIESDGVNVDWIDLGGVNRTTWPSGGGGGSGLPMYPWEYLFYTNATSNYLVDETGSIVSSGTDQTIWEYAANNTSGGQWYVSPGTYTINNINVDTANVRITGASRGATVLYTTTANAHYILQLSGQHGYVEHLTLDGNDVADNNLILSGGRTRARHIISQDADEAQFYLTSTGGCAIDDFHAVRTHGAKTAGTIGVLIHDNAADIEIENGIIYYCETGFVIDGGTVRLFDNHIWGNEWGIELRTTPGECWIENNFIEDQDQEAIIAKSGTVVALTISGNLFDQNCEQANDTYYSIDLAPSGTNSIQSVIINDNNFDRLPVSGNVPKGHINIDDTESRWIEICNNNFYPEVTGSTWNFYGSWVQSEPAINFPSPDSTEYSLIKDNIGFVTQNTAKTTVAVDGVGYVTGTITHGLDVTPNSEDIVWSFGQETSATDFRCQFMGIQTISSTTVQVRIYVTDAGSAGSTVELIAHCDASKFD